MTDQEKAIVMAYTGICMLSGDKFQIFHKYIEDILGRPVYTHELAYDTVEHEIKEKAKADFMALCAEQEPKMGQWIDTGSGQECSSCGEIQYGYDNFRNFCPNCGAKMVEEQNLCDTNPFGDDRFGG